MTLPLIYALQQSSNTQKKHIINLIKNHSNETSKVREVIEWVNNSGGIDYDKEKMNAFCAEARNILFQVANNDATASLSLLIDYVTTREK